MCYLIDQNRFLIQMISFIQSEEDKQLKEELDLCVERLKVEIQNQKTKNFRFEIQRKQ